MEWILAVVGLVAGLVGAFMSSNSVSETNQTNRDIAGQQNQFNLEQWQREVAYNTPLQQRQRLEQAGLNPSLAMTQGNVFSTEVAHGFPAAGSTMQPFTFDTSSLGQMIANTPMQSAQIEQAKAQAQDLTASAALKESQMTTQQKMQLKIDQDIKESDERIKAIQSDVALNKIKGFAEYTTSVSMFNKTLAEINLIGSQKDLNQQLKTQSEEYVRQIQGSLDLMVKQGNYFNALTKNTSQMTQQQKTEFESKYGRTDAEVAQNVRLQISKALGDLTHQLHVLEYVNSHQDLINVMTSINMVLSPLNDMLKAVSAGATVAIR